MADDVANHTIGGRVRTSRPRTCGSPLRSVPAGAGLAATAAAFGGDLYIHGVLAWSQWFMLSSMALSAMLVFTIEREFLKAAIWACVSTGLAFVGLTHSYRLTPARAESALGHAAADRTEAPPRPLADSGGVETPATEGESA